MNILSEKELEYEIKLIANDILYFKNYKKQLINFLLSEIKTRKNFIKKSQRIIDEIGNINNHLFYLTEQETLLNEQKQDYDTNNNPSR